MYKIIGADGRQYGPVSAEQILQWLSQNRVQAQTLAQAEGSPDWKELSTFPELAGAFSTQAPPTITPLPTGSGALPAPDVEVLAAAIHARGGRVEIGRCLSRSWDLLTRNFWLIVGASFVLGLVQASIGLLAGVCMGGLYFLLLKLIRGERAEFGDAFAGFSLAFLQLFLAGLVSALLTAVGLLLCILPGIYLLVAWLFAFALVIDRKLEFWPAMELSRRVVNRHWWSLFGLCLVNLIVVLAGRLISPIATPIVSFLIGVPLS